MNFDDMKRKAKDAMNEMTDDNKKDNNTSQSQPNAEEQIKKRRNSDNSIM